VAHTWYKRASTSGGGKRSMLGSSVGHSATTCARSLQRSLFISPTVVTDRRREGLQC
jgi:hypothetical protein